jgi:hypothetical protein
MARKRSRRAGSPLGKGTQHGAKKSRSDLILSRRDTSRKSSTRAPHRKQLTSVQQKQRIAAFELERLRRQGLSWKVVEEQSGIARRTAQRLFPRAFFLDKRGRLQVRGYDPYTRRLKIPTTNPGEFSWVRARGSHQASLVGTWLNALKAAGHGDFSLIDAFPRNVSIDGVRLATSRYEVSRIVVAAAESDQPFEDIYAMVGGA